MSVSPSLDRSIILTLVFASLKLAAETDTGFGYPSSFSPAAVVTRRLPDTMKVLSNSPGSQEIGITLKRSHGCSLSFETDIDLRRRLTPRILGYYKSNSVSCLRCPEVITRLRRNEMKRIIGRNVMFFRKKYGTRGRTRTGTLLRAGDFESPVSTNFTTLACVDYRRRRSISGRAKSAI